MNILVSQEELIEMTGYESAACQLKELHKRGYRSAYRNRNGKGKVVLPRAAVEGAVKKSNPNPFDFEQVT